MGIQPMKSITTVFLCFIILACSSINRIDYTADTSNVKDPISIIKATLEQQPPAYAYVPAKVEVTNELITLYMVEPGKLSMFIGGSSIVPTLLYFRNLGDPRISRSTKYPIWHVEIYDTFGNDLYWVCTQEEKEAKKFVDAMYYMIEINRR